MFAIVLIGGKQYRVSEGTEIYVEKLDKEAGSKIVFKDNILMVDGEIGQPYLPKASIECEVVKQGKQKKLVIIKHISQKHHTKKQGHRQPYTKLKVLKITK